MAQEAFPLHFLVWNNQYLELDRELQKKEVGVGRWGRYMYIFTTQRCVGRVGLHCADAAFRMRFLSRMWSAWIRGGAPLWSWLCAWATWSQPGCFSDTPQTPHTATHRAGPVSVSRNELKKKRGTHCCQTWMFVSVLQEAVSTGDPELVQLVLQYRDFKRATERLAGIPELLSKLRRVKPARRSQSQSIFGECLFLLGDFFLKFLLLSRLRTSTWR